jgi:sterol desaturase/sphingolipid hydroxylase (fatty acid hydroxylase superfamily)
MLASMLVGSVKALLLAAAVFIPFERLAGLHRTQRTFRRGWATDVFTWLMNGLLLYAVLLFVLGGLDAVAAACAPQLRNWIETRPLLAQCVLALALGDLGVYGIHRLEHTVPWLWRFHAVHHSAEEMDWLVALRFHPVDLFLVRVASLGPLVALHVTPSAIAVFIAVYGWQGWLVHANVRMPYGPLRWLVVSPEFHHWHHSAERDSYDRNYASLVAFWDVLFGTVHLPRGRQPLRYGLDERVPAGCVERFFYPFRGRVGAATGRTNSPAHGAQIATRNREAVLQRSNQLQPSNLTGQWLRP